MCRTFLSPRSKKRRSMIPTTLQEIPRKSNLQAQSTTLSRVKWSHHRIAAWKYTSEDSNRLKYVGHHRVAKKCERQRVVSHLKPQQFVCKTKEWKRKMRYLSGANNVIKEQYYALVFGLGELWIDDHGSKASQIEKWFSSLSKTCNIISRIYQNLKRTLSFVEYDTPSWCS